LGNTGLESQVHSNSITGFTKDVSKLIVDYYLSSSEANGSTLTEAGVKSGTTLFSRAIHTAKVKDSTKAYTYSWEYTFSS
jgi:hypothetical protein